MAQWEVKLSGDTNFNTHKIICVSLESNTIIYNNITALRKVKIIYGSLERKLVLPVYLISVILKCYHRMTLAPVFKFRLRVLYRVGIIL